LSPDPAKRIQAAQSVFKSHDAAFLPVVETALQKPTARSAHS
jgi:urea transport system permease protein